MWNSRKIIQAANSITEFANDELKREVRALLDASGVDLGEGLLGIYLRNFQDSFMKQFWNGDDRVDFEIALYRLKVRHGIYS